MRNPQELVAIMTLFYTMMFLMVFASGSSSSNSPMFTLSDVTLLFPAPLSSNKILVYGLVRQLGLSLVLGFFILFQYSWMHGVYGVEPVHLALIIVGYGLTLFFAQLASMASYVRTSGMERAGKTVRYCVFGAAALYGMWAVLSCREELLALAGGGSYQPLLEKGAAFFATLPGLLFAGDIVRLFGGTGNVFTMAQTYLRVILLFSPAFLMNNVLLCFVRNDGAPQLSMAAMIGGSLSNVVLDWVFIFPCGMGIFGAVFATGLAPIISMDILSPHFFRRKNNFHPVDCRPQGRTLGRILSSGAPSLVTEASSGIVIIAFNALIMGLEGNTGVAAYGVIANLSLVVIAIYTGIAQGIQPILSRSYGAGDRKSLTAILRYAMMTMVCVSVVIYGAVLACAPQIAAVFNSEGNATLQAIAEQGLRLYFIACPFAGCNVVMAMYFTSTERPLPAHAISLLRGFFIILPMAFLLAAVGQMVGI